MSDPEARDSDGPSSPLPPDGIDASQLPAGLEAGILESLSDIPPDDRTKVARRVRMAIRQEMFSGPIAHPAHLREYEIIHPGSAERIIRMAEKQLDHRMEMERIALEADTGDGRRGLWIGGSVFVLLILCAFFAMYNDKGIGYVAIFLGAAAIGGVGLFVREQRGTAPTSDE